MGLVCYLEYFYTIAVGLSLVFKTPSLLNGLMEYLGKNYELCEGADSRGLQGVCFYDVGVWSWILNVFILLSLVHHTMSINLRVKLQDQHGCWKFFINIFNLFTYKGNSIVQRNKYRGSVKRKYPEEVAGFDSICRDKCFQTYTVVKNLIVMIVMLIMAQRMQQLSERVEDIAAANLNKIDEEACLADTKG